MKHEGSSQAQPGTDSEQLRRRVSELEQELAVANESIKVLGARAAEHEAIFQAFPDLGFRFDAQGTILGFHAGRSSDLFTTPDQFLGMQVQEILPPDIGQQHLDAIARCLSGTVTTLVYALPVPDGEKVFEARFIPLPDGQVYDVVRDITERTQWETALRDSERWLQEAQAIAHVGHWRCAISSGVVTGSDEFFRVMGLQDNAATLAELASAIHVENRQLHNGHLQQAIECGVAWDIELRLAVADGGYRVIHSKGEALANASGATEFLIGTIQDITDRKNRERERLRLEQKLQQAQRLESLGILAGGIAHDFNNMLCGILGNIGLVQSALSPEFRLYGAVREIANTAQKCAGLTNQMLAYAGRGRLSVEQIALPKLVHELDDLLRSSISKRASLEVGFQEELPAVTGDASQLTQLIMNLVINASDAIGDSDGEISLLATTAEYDAADPDTAWLAEVGSVPGRQCLVISVRDTGCGMDEQTRGRIFDPFFTTKFTGRGLGLAAVYGVVRAHHGAIRVDSTPGAGTTFKVALPTGDTAAVTAGPEPQVDDDWRGSGTILLVDDEPIVRRVTAQMLESFGFSVIQAVDGLEAVELFRTHSAEIACVLLDLTMPRMGGEETFSRLQEICQDVVVIISSGFSAMEAAERFAGKGIAGVIDKPYDATRLQERLRQALAR